RVPENPGRADFGAATIEELRGLAAALGLAPPWILVAHSMGGLYANLHARLFPDEVAGVVLVDATRAGAAVRARCEPLHARPARGGGAVGPAARPRRDDGGGASRGDRRRDPARAGVPRYSADGGDGGHRAAA